MGQLFELVNGVLIPHNVSLSNEQNFQNTAGQTAIPQPTAEQLSAALLNSIQNSTVQPPNTQNAEQKTDESSAAEAGGGSLYKNNAYKELYENAQAEIEKKNKENAALQVELAKWAVIGSKQQEQTVDLDKALSEFFGYTE